MIPLEDCLKQVRLLYGVNFPESKAKYHEMELEVLKEMATEGGYKAKMMDKLINDRAISKVYDFYSEKFD